MPRSSRAPTIPDPKLPIEVAQAAKLLAQGHTYVEIGAQLGYRPSSIRRRLLEHGIRPRKRPPIRHGRLGGHLYSVWKRMRRSANELGVDVFEEWRSFEAFFNWARSSGHRTGLVLRRKREKGPYTPANCLWSTRTWHSPKRAKTNGAKKRLTEAEWKKAQQLHVESHLSCPEIARRLGVSYGTILRGLKQRSSYSPPRPGVTGTTHGRKLYQSWLRVRSRCYDPDDPAYQYYGAKGATICREWEHFATFYEWALSAGWKEHLCLTRIQGLHFSPTNCSWVTRAEAARNAHHPSAKMPPQWTVTAFNESKGPTEWSRDKRCAVSLPGLLRRLRRGWDAESAISTPAEHSTGPRPRHFVTAFGVTKSVTEWTKDHRCKVTLVTLLRRLNKKMAPEDAIATRPFRVP
jgi:DNA-binding CsgD family transcriptional regulator